MRSKDEFSVESEKNGALFGFFEDDGDTGYLYLYEPDGAGIIDHLQIYRRGKVVGIKEEDIEVMCSKDKSKLGVKIWGKVYGIFDQENRYIDQKSGYSSNSRPDFTPRALKFYGD